LSPTGWGVQGLVKKANRKFYSGSWGERSGVDGKRVIASKRKIEKRKKEWSGGERKVVHRTLGHARYLTLRSITVRGGLGGYGPAIGGRRERSRNGTQPLSPRFFWWGLLQRGGKPVPGGENRSFRFLEEWGKIGDGPHTGRWYWRVIDFTKGGDWIEQQKNISGPRNSLGKGDSSGVLTGEELKKREKKKKRVRELYLKACW